MILGVQHSSLPCCDRFTITDHGACQLSNQGAATSSEESWIDRFADSSAWKNGRLSKSYLRSTDFVHESSKASFWIDIVSNPQWTEEQRVIVSKKSRHCKVVRRAVNRQDCSFDWGDPNNYYCRWPFKHKVDQATFLKAVKNESFSGFVKDLQKLCEEGVLNEALQAVVAEGVHAFTNVFFRLLQRCIRKKDLIAGREVYRLMMRIGCESDAFLGMHVIRMFGACGSLLEANHAFDKIVRPDVFVWSAIISVNSNLGEDEEAIKLYYQMRLSRIKADSHVFVAALKACASASMLAEGKLIHGHIQESGFDSDIFVNSVLVDMYAKCGSLEDAHNVFDTFENADTVMCTALISGYVQHGHGQVALQLFEQMQEGGMEPNQVTFTSILKAYSGAGALIAGRSMHAHIVDRGYEVDDFVGCSLIDMYIRCDSLEDSRKVFHKLPNRNMVTWTTMIAAYSHHGCSHHAFQLFQQMQWEGIQPDQIAFVSILKACSYAATLDVGRLIHTQIIESGFESDFLIGNSLIDMHAKCGSVQEARWVFDRMAKRDVVTWTSMIEGYAQYGDGLEALKLFEQMHQGGEKLTQATFVSILKACSSIAAVDQGKLIHVLTIESGLQSDLFVGSSLMDMYAKCGCLEESCKVFDRLPQKDVVTWTAAIAGYARYGCGQEALHLFKQMQEEGVMPNQATFVNILKACSSVAALNQGRLIHVMISRSGFESDLFLGNTLIDMYAKCGSLEDACSVFHRLPDRDVVTWTAMIDAYAHHGHTHNALQLFKRMQQDGIKPVAVTFICLLSACSRVGLVDEGCQYFKLMREEYGVAPALDHYNCVVELFSSAGYLIEAEDLLQTIPFQLNIVGWKSLLGHCRAQGNVKLARQCFDNVVTLDYRNATGYMLMSNIYTNSGTDHDGEEVEELRTYANAWRRPGTAFIEVGHDVHDFIVGSKCHPQNDAIYAELKRLSLKMCEEGYMPVLDAVLQSRSEKEPNNDNVCQHCEKLAIAFGLISTPQGTTIRVSKNLRVCRDCHSISKVISKMEMREIIITDSHCIHHFKDGVCSCNC